MSAHPSYRTQTGLSEWAKEVLDRRVYAVLATANPDGSAHTVPVGYAFDGERFLIPSGSGTRKVRSIERDSRVRVLVQAPAVEMGMDGWVAADGEADVLRGEEGRRLNFVASARYLTESGRASYHRASASFMDVTIVVRPVRWQTWTAATVMDSMLELGFSEEEMAGWFLPMEY
jgi:PPOX class probable F420-dependent enzyme